MEGVRVPAISQMRNAGGQGLDQTHQGLPAPGPDMRLSGSGASCLPGRGQNFRVHGAVWVLQLVPLGVQGERAEGSEPLRVGPAGCDLLGGLGPLTVLSDL